MKKAGYRNFRTLVFTTSSSLLFILL